MKLSTITSNKSFITFNDFYMKYIQQKYINEDVANFLYTKYKNEAVENKTDNQIKIINLYETYAHIYLGVNNVYNAYNNYINQINEGILTSYNYDTFAMYFEKYTGITDILDFSYVDNHNALTKILQIVIYSKDYQLHKKQIEQYIEKCGYFISSIYADNKLTNIQFEPKYIYELTSNNLSGSNSDLIYDKNNDMIQNKCNGILYHITIGNKYDKIINNGLIPKSYKKKAYHPERIYFYQSNLLNNPYTDLRLQAKYLYKKGDTFVDTVKKYVTDKGLSVIILKIDLYKYDKVKYRFFQDPNHPQGIFTYEPIHPVCVELYDSFYLK